MARSWTESGIQHTPRTGTPGDSGLRSTEEPTTAYPSPGVPGSPHTGIAKSQPKPQRGEDYTDEPFVGAKRFCVECGLFRILAEDNRCYDCIYGPENLTKERHKLWAISHADLVVNVLMHQTRIWRSTPAGA